METTDSKQLLFVGADLTGIQRFLYNITSYKAAVSLKGRSHYLNDYLDTIHHRLLSNPSITPYTGNGVINGEVYHSGGKLYLIVEDTPQTRAAIDSLWQESELELWNKHKGMLGINLCHVPFTFNSDDSITLSDGTHGNLGLLWKQASIHFAQGKARKFSHLMDEHYSELFCPQPISEKMHVCALTGIESEDCVPLDEGKYVLPSVMEQIETGKQLQRQQGFKSFEEYAADSWLGVLRMDVDGLGAVFAEGFGTINEYRLFSERLQLFFSERLPIFSNKYANQLMVLYAGGDDMFVVGRWDAVVDFAKEVRDAFVAYIDRPGVTLSGGMVVVDPKFPIAKAAELAGDAEDAAKRFRNGEKNAFCLLGHCISWEKEYDYTYQWKDRMETLCYSGSLPRSILHKLIAFNNMREQGEVSYLWNAAYYLSRFSKDKKNDTVTQFCNEIQQAFFNTTSGSRNVELIALAARWAELRLRTIKQ